METPVVATDAGGTEEMIENGRQGIVIPRNSVAALAGAIAQLMDAPDERAALARSARERVEGPLSFRARMRRVEDICEDVVEAHPGARQRA